MPDQYNKLIGYTLKYPYLVGISTESGNLGTGILISDRLVLTCGHLLHDFTSAEVISQEGSTRARAKKVDHDLDLALLELTRPISAAKVDFTDRPLQPGVVLLAAGVQETPGQSDKLSVAEIELKYRNKNDADGKILDIQLEGGARPGYSGGPVVVEEGGALLCVGVMCRGGHGASSTNAIGLGSIRAFVAEYTPVASLQEGKSGTKTKGVRQLRRNSSPLSRPLVFTAILCAAVAFCATAVWHNLASNSPKVTNGTVIVTTQEPEKPALSRTALGESRLPSFSQAPSTRRNLKTKDSALQKDGTPTTAPAKVEQADSASAEVQTRSSSTTVRHPEHGISEDPTDTQEPLAKPQAPATVAANPPSTIVENVDPGNPNVTVWVNTSSRSRVYHCPGKRWYGQTQHGEYMTQAEAQKKAYRPADWQACK